MINSVPTRGLLIPNNIKKVIIQIYWNSVPTRGLLIPNRLRGENIMAVTKTNSVPTRGLLIPNPAFATPVFIRG